MGRAFTSPKNTPPPSTQAQAPQPRKHQDHPISKRSQDSSRVSSGVEVGVGVGVGIVVVVVVGPVAVAVAVAVVVVVVVVAVAVAVAVVVVVV